MWADFIPECERLWRRLHSPEVSIGKRGHLRREREPRPGMLCDRAVGCAIRPLCSIRGKSFGGCPTGRSPFRSRCPRPRSCLRLRASPAVLGTAQSSCDGFLLVGKEKSLLL